jgi:hypothetical protein
VDTSALINNDVALSIVTDKDYDGLEIIRTYNEQRMTN